MVVVEACNELMGHAGAVVRHPDGSTEAATDPRSDGKAFATASSVSTASAGQGEI